MDKPILVEDREVQLQQIRIRLSDCDSLVGDPECIREHVLARLPNYGRMTMGSRIGIVIKGPPA